MVLAIIFALVRLMDNHFTPLFLDEDTNAQYLSLLVAYTVLTLGIALMKSIEGTLESTLIAIVLLVPLGYKIGKVLHEWYLKKVIYLFFNQLKLLYLLKIAILIQFILKD